MSSPSYSISKEELANEAKAVNYQLTESKETSHEADKIVSTFLNTSTQKLTGENWDVVKANLQTYNEWLAYSEKINQVIVDANKEYIQALFNFLDTDDELNTDDLPALEAERDRLDAEIKRLETENEKLAAMMKETVTVNDYDDEGNCIGSHEVPKYDNAALQREIDANDRMIAELTPQLNECNRLIDKINEFVNVLIPGLNKKLEETEKEVQKYLARINDIKISLLEKDILGGKLPGTALDRTDTAARDERAVELYDLLIERGYSDLGARAIIANMNAESNMVAHRYQGSDPMHYPGYGLCQWERVLAGGIGCGTAYKMINWCDANGFDFTTAKGQIAYLDYDLKENHPQLYDQLKTDWGFTADDYDNNQRCRDEFVALVGKFGTQYEAGGDASRWESSKSRGYMALNEHIFEGIDNRSTKSGEFVPNQSGSGKDTTTKTWERPTATQPGWGDSNDTGGSYGKWSRPTATQPGWGDSNDTGGSYGKWSRPTATQPGWGDSNDTGGLKYGYGVPPVTNTDNELETINQLDENPNLQNHNPPSGGYPSGGGGGYPSGGTNPPKVQTDPIEEEPKLPESQTPEPQQPIVEQKTRYTSTGESTHHSNIQSNKENDVLIEHQESITKDESFNTLGTTTEVVNIKDLSNELSKSGKENDWVKKVLTGAGVTAATVGAFGIPLYDSNKKKKEKDAEEEK